MKSYRFLSYTLAAIAGLILSAQSGLAQPGGGGMGGGRGGFGLGPDATDEQRTAYQQYIQEISTLNEKVATARTELSEAVFAEKVDEAQIKQKAAALAKAEEEQALGQARAFAKIRSKLTSEQIERIKNMSARGGGAFGRGRGGGRGGQ